MIEVVFKNCRHDTTPICTWCTESICYFKLHFADELWFSYKHSKMVWLHAHYNFEIIVLDLAFKLFANVGWIPNYFQWIEISEIYFFFGWWGCKTYSVQFCENGMEIAKCHRRLFQIRCKVKHRWSFYFWTSTACMHTCTHTHTFTRFEMEGH